MQGANDCLLCSFKNPKPSVTAICIRDGKLLVAKRNEEPFRGQWDFIGGYVQKDETLEKALKREMKEELGVDAALTYIGSFPGTASYNNHSFPILNFAYFAEFSEEIVLNEENSEIAWVSFADLSTIAFDSNQKILSFVKKNFAFDLSLVRTLAAQLDPSAEVREQSLYTACMNGYINQMYDNGRLVGMGWIFPRQTLLRKQAVIEDMIVDEHYRGRGYGEKILSNLLDWARINHIEVIELTTNPKRLAANGLYKKFGFVLHETNHYLLNMRK